MHMAFQEIDRRATPMGEISLRRRWEPVLEVDVFEVQLGDEFLMSSLFTVAERALATLGLGQLDTSDTAAGRDGLSVVVGGLGLGYTARAVLENPHVQSLTVVDALPEVIAWHEQHLLPDAEALTSDPRCHLVTGDFFALSATGEGYGAPAAPPFDAVLVDIDHTPAHHLHPTHAAFYTPEGLGTVAAQLVPGGVFGLWSDDPPDPEFVALLDSAFTTSAAHLVSFPNPYTGSESANTVYLATT